MSSILQKEEGNYTDMMVALGLTPKAVENDRFGDISTYITKKRSIQARNLQTR